MQEGPGEAAVAAVDQPSESPERLWTRHMATSTAEEVAHLASSARSTQVCLRHLQSVLTLQEKHCAGRLASPSLPSGCALGPKVKIEGEMCCTSAQSLESISRSI